MWGARCRKVFRGWVFEGRESRSLSGVRHRVMEEEVGVLGGREEGVGCLVQRPAALSGPVSLSRLPPAPPPLPVSSTHHTK